MGLVLISHDLAVIANTVDRIVVMYGGAVVESAPTRELFAHLSHPYTQGLLSGIPQVGSGARGSGRRLQSIPGAVPELHDLPAGCTFADRCDLAQPACRDAPPGHVAVGRGHMVACRRVDAARERWRSGSAS